MLRRILAVFKVCASWSETGSPEAYHLCGGCVAYPTSEFMDIERTTG